MNDDKLTEKEIAEYQKNIDLMSQTEMASLWRFAPAGHIYFRSDIPELSNYFNKRFFDELGGFTHAISKDIGW